MSPLRRTAFFLAVALGGGALAAAACRGSSTDASGDTSPDGAPAPATTSTGSPAPTSSLPADATVDAEPEPTFDNGGRICTGVTRSTAPDTTDDLTFPAEIKVAPGFVMEAVARINGARHIAPLANGDLIVGTLSDVVWYVPHADAAKAGAPTYFLQRTGEEPVHGVFFHEPSCNVFAASQTSIYRIPYSDAQTTATAGEPIAHVRPGGNSGHQTTSVAVAGKYLYAGVGSSCNECVETDPTRATVQRMNIDGTDMQTYARRLRNPIALAVNPATHTLWAGNAGQDGLPLGHPFELFDAVTVHPIPADYGWPDCEENQKAYKDGVDCSGTVVPRVELPAYSTLVGAAFYPANQAGAHAFPAAYRGGVFIAAHGSWHEQPGGGFYSPPRVVFVPMNGDVPKTPVDWNDPSKQWTELVSGYEAPNHASRYGRPSGLAVGKDGSLYLGDDALGLVFRIRPAP